MIEWTDVEGKKQIQNVDASGVISRTESYANGEISLASTITETSSIVKRYDVTGKEVSSIIVSHNYYEVSGERQDNESGSASVAARAAQYAGIKKFSLSTNLKDSFDYSYEDSKGAMHWVADTAGINGTIDLKTSDEHINEIISASANNIDFRKSSQSGLREAHWSTGGSSGSMMFKGAALSWAVDNSGQLAVQYGKPGGASLMYSGDTYMSFVLNGEMINSGLSTTYVNDGFVTINKDKGGWSLKIDGSSNVRLSSTDGALEFSVDGVKVRSSTDTGWSFDAYGKQVGIEEYDVKNGLHMINTESGKIAEITTYTTVGADGSDAYYGVYASAFGASTTFNPDHEIYQDTWVDAGSGIRTVENYGSDGSLDTVERYDSQGKKISSEHRADGYMIDSELWDEDSGALKEYLSMLGQDIQVGARDENGVYIPLGSIDGNGVYSELSTDSQGNVNTTKLYPNGMVDSVARDLGQDGHVIAYFDEGGGLLRFEREAGISSLDYIGGSVEDVVIGSGQEDTIVGGAGNDTLAGGSGANIIAGGTGNDILDSGEGNDVFLFDAGDGQDTIFQSGEPNRIIDGVIQIFSESLKFGIGIGAADVIFRKIGADLMVLLSNSSDSILLNDWFRPTKSGRLDRVEFSDGTILSSDQMLAAAFIGGAGADAMEGLDISDTLEGAEGNDSLNGYGGGDNLLGGAGDDILDGGAGSDLLTGGAGADVYLFGYGSGSDIVVDWSKSIGEHDSIRFDASVSTADIELLSQNDDLLIKIRDSQDTLTLQGYFSSDVSPRGEMQFSDGTVWKDYETIARFLTPTLGDDNIRGSNASDSLSGLAGDDHLAGRGGDDLIEGGSGDDWLDGGAGQDVYLYAKGDGSDHIVTSAGPGSDTIRFDSTIKEDEIIASRSQSDLYLSLLGNGRTDVLTLADWFGGDGKGDGADRVTAIEFSDGTVWDVGTILSQLNTPTAGNDYLSGTEGDDVLAGMAGDDVIFGMGGDDTLEGGQGHDVLSGGQGNDVYRYNGGVLTIDDWSLASGEQDSLEISGVSPDGLVLQNSAGDLVIADSEGYLIIRVVGYFVTNSGGELKSGDIAFADGTIWSRATVVGMLAQLVATEDGDQLRLTAAGVIDGLGGGDHIVGVSSSTLHGGDGNDLVEIVGVGNDAILHGDNGNDRLQIESGARDLLYGDAGDDSMQVRNGSGVMMDGGAGADYLELDDGDNNTLRGGADRDNMQIRHGGNNWLYGDSGNDTIHVDGGGQSNHGYGGEGDDTLMGADGSSVELYGDDGNDQLQWERGSGHRLYGGEGNDQLQINGGSAHLLDGGAGNDTLRGFSDNATLLGGDGADTMQANNTGASMDGGAGNDLMNIYAGNSTLIGGDGDDTLDGSNSNLVMRGGAGKDKLSTNGSFNLLDGGGDDDSVNVGGGSDMTILGGEGNDTLTLGAGARNLLDGGDGDDILQVGAYQANVVRGGAGADTIGVNYGSARIEGGSGNDTIKTGTTNQFVAGGTGDDRITLQNGADIVAFNLGDGKDTIDGTDVTATLSLGGGVEYADLLFSRDQTDLVLKVGDSDQLRFKDWYNADGLHRTVSQLQFIVDGGSSYDASSSDALRNQRTTLFDFQQLVDTFDSAQVADPTLNAWSVTSALMSAHLSGGSSDAIGGELAYQYGRSGNLDGLTMQASVALLAALEFGAARQQFQPLTS